MFQSNLKPLEIDDQKFIIQTKTIDVLMEKIALEIWGRTSQASVTQKNNLDQQQELKIFYSDCAFIIVVIDQNDGSSINRFKMKYMNEINYISNNRNNIPIFIIGCCFNNLKKNISNSEIQNFAKENDWGFAFALNHNDIDNALNEFAKIAYSIGIPIRFPDDYKGKLMINTKIEGSRSNKSSPTRMKKVNSKSLFQIFLIIEKCDKTHIGLSMMVTSHPMLRPMTAHNSKEHLNYTFNPLTNLKSQFSLSLLSNSAYCTVGNVLLNIVSSSHIEGE